MIQKVLIVEDHESVNISLQKTLDDLGITGIDTVYYCDDAMQAIETAIKKGATYDLMITDLYFEPDHREQQLAGGMALIEAARKVQPALKVLVFSAESKPAVIDMLFQQYDIDGYVRKARNDAKELRSAISCIENNQRYIPRRLNGDGSSQASFHFTDYDITIIKLLADGVLQKNIPFHLKMHNSGKTSLSSVEKRLKTIRETLHLHKNEQLVIFCRDMGII